MQNDDQLQGSIDAITAYVSEFFNAIAAHDQVSGAKLDAMLPTLFADPKFDGVVKGLLKNGQAAIAPSPRADA